MSYKYKLLCNFMHTPMGLLNSSHRFTVSHTSLFKFGDFCLLMDVRWYLICVFLSWASCMLTVIMGHSSFLSHGLPVLIYYLCIGLSFSYWYLSMAGTLEIIVDQMGCFYPVVMFKKCMPYIFLVFENIFLSCESIWF